MSKKRKVRNKTNKENNQNTTAKSLNKADTINAQGVDDRIIMTKHEITDEIVACLSDNMMTTKEVNEICFAVLYHTLLNPSNVIVMKEKLGIDILQLKGNDLVDFVHAINKTMVQLKDDFSNIHQLVGDDK